MLQTEVPFLLSIFNIWHGISWLRLFGLLVLCPVGELLQRIFVKRMPCWASPHGVRAWRARLVCASGVRVAEAPQVALWATKPLERGLQIRK